MDNIPWRIVQSLFVCLFACFLLIFIFGQHIHVSHLQGGPKPTSDCSGQEENI